MSGGFLQQRSPRPESNGKLTGGHGPHLLCRVGKSSMMYRAGVIARAASVRSRSRVPWEFSPCLNVRAFRKSIHRGRRRTVIWHHPTDFVS